MIGLSASGKRQLRRMLSFVERHEARIARALGPAEQRQLIRLLSKIHGRG